MRIRITILEPITSPFGTCYIDSSGNFTSWKYCEKINSKWYFRLEQKWSE